MNSKVLYCAAAAVMTLGCVQQQSVGMVREFREQFASATDLGRVNAVLGAPKIAGDLINWSVGFSDDDLFVKSDFMREVNTALTEMTASVLAKIENECFNEIKDAAENLFEHFGIKERSSRFFCITLHHSLVQAMRARAVIEDQADGQRMTEIGRESFVSIGYHRPNGQEKALMEMSIDNIVKFTRIYVIWQQLQGAPESGKDFSELCSSLVRFLY